MGKFDGVLLATDYDDTLHTLPGGIPRRTLDAIDYFIREGGRFTVATGRAYATFAPERERHSIPLNAPAVLFNGAMIYDFERERCLYETHLPDRARADLKALVTAFPSLGMAVYQGGDVYIHNPNRVTADYVRHVGVTMGEAALEDIPLPWRKVVLHQDNSVLREVQGYARARWGEVYEVIFSNAYLLEFTVKGSSKGGQVARVAEMLGIEADHIYCVGDNQNDVPMLEMAAVGFAPENCSPEVRATGVRMVGSCADGCVADVIAILDEMYA